MLSSVALGWVAGLFVGALRDVEGGLPLAGPSVLVAGFLALHATDVRARLWVAALGTIAFVAGLSVESEPRMACPGRGEITAEGVVDRVRFGIDDAAAWVRVQSGRWAGSRARVPEGLVVRLRVPMDEAPVPQSRVAFDAKIWPTTELRNDPPKARGVRRGCLGRTIGTEAVRTVASPRVHGWMARLRAKVRQRFVEGLPAPVASVARALVLGDGGALPYEQRRTVAAVGLAHLFAVSGLHIALVSGTLVHLLGWLLRGSAVRLASVRVAASAGIPLTLLHAQLAGGAPSAWRAAITAALTWAVVALGRRPSPVQVTAGAAILLSAPNPSLAVRPAFLLSIVATSAILSASTVPPGRFRRLRATSTVSARTLVATAPLVWWWFGGVPLIGWVTNIVVLPLGSLVVIPLAHAYAIAGALPHVGPWLGLGLKQAVGLLLWACDAFAPLAVAQRLPPLSSVQVIVVALGCALLLATRRWRTRGAVVLVAALVWAVAEDRIRGESAPTGELRVAFVDVAQGDAALIDFPDGSLALVDTGQGAQHPAGTELVRLLRERRRSRIDRVILTHGHPDHMGALPQLLEEVEIGELWINGQRLAEERDGAMATLLTKARAAGVRVREVGEVCGAKDFGGAVVEVLWPCPRYDAGFDLNDNSITMRLRFGAHAFLLTGDLEQGAERRLVDAGLVERVDVLKVAHHGSKTSSSQAFVDAARPAVAVISVGRGNRYGHPDAGVLGRLRGVGARVFRTDRDGGVTVVSDGQELRVWSWREGEIEDVDGYEDEDVDE